MSDDFEGPAARDGEACVPGAAAQIEDACGPHASCQIGQAVQIPAARRGSELPSRQVMLFHVEPRVCRSAGPCRPGPIPGQAG